MEVTITKTMKTDQRLNPSMSYKLSINFCYIHIPQVQKYSIKKMYEIEKLYKQKNRAILYIDIAESPF